MLAKLEGHTDGVWSAELSTDGLRVVTASNDKTARICNATTGQLLATLDGHNEKVLTAAFSPDGQRVVAASGGKAVIFKVTTIQDIAQLQASKPWQNNHPKKINPQLPSFQSLTSQTPKIHPTKTLSHKCKQTLIIFLTISF